LSPARLRDGIPTRRARHDGDDLPVPPLGPTMSTSIRLLIVHEDSLYRQCLAAALAAAGRFAAIAVAGSPSEAIPLLQQSPADLLLLDWNLPNQGGVALARWVASNLPGVRVLVLGLTETSEAVRECAEAGSTGYVVKGASLEELLTHIEQVLRGEAACSPRAVRFLFGHLAELAQRRRDGNDREEALLTAREREILSLIAEGLSNKEIAGRLRLSLHTVKNHIHNLLEKLAVPGRHAAVRYAYERRWLVPSPAGPLSFPPGPPASPEGNGA
jgi:DNA-binding NarL/FixJ family response regulator